MIDFESRQIIEALRSGVASRTTAQAFSSARPELLSGAAGALDEVVSTGCSAGRIVSGKYGEGKTHFLNTVFNMAHQRNMVVSHISLSKETPFDKQALVYQKLMSNTYLPGRLQPGFEQVLESMTISSPLATELLAFAQTELDTNRLYYLLKSYLGTEDDDEKYMLLADLNGDFITNAALKQIYKRIYDEKVIYTANFSKTKHSMNYFAFMSRLFSLKGYSGWVLLFDETELIGRLGKKARINAYRAMSRFLFPEKDNLLHATYSVFALTASYTEDVIDSKHEFENLNDITILPADRNAAGNVLELIRSTQQFSPLSDTEIRAVLAQVRELHGKAYSWTPCGELDELCSVSDKRGYLLRTRIRAAIEFLDQLYQYGQTDSISVTELGGECYDEDIPSLEELL